jgi:integrase
MATIRKRNGKWAVEVRKVGYPKLHRTFFEKTTALKFAKDIETQMDKNIFEDYSGTAGLTLKVLLIKYRNEITANKKGVDEETSKINVLLKNKVCLHSLMALRSHHLYSFKTEWSKTRSAATVNKYINLMSHAWTTARKVWGIALPPQNPFELVTLDKEAPPRDRVLTREEYQKLLQACSLSHYAYLKDAVEFAYLVGARQGEILRLKYEHINFERKVCTFYDTKNGEDRTVPLSDYILNILKNHRFGPFVFNVLKRRLRKHFDIAKRKAGITNFRFHDLRACFCTNALLSGWTIPQVAAVTGHKDWSQLKRYARIKADDLVDKINNLNVVNLKN